MIKRDQCPHCFKKIEHELWINRTGCPYCGKRIIMEVQDEPEAQSYYASFPKVPPKLDWFVMPFTAAVVTVLPVVRWLMAGPDPEAFETAQIVRDAGICAAAGAAFAYVYFRLKRRFKDNDGYLRLLNWSSFAFVLLATALYVTR
jgi:predicted  nucleic acid-binding Zn-ribbon protein